MPMQFRMGRNDETLEHLGKIGGRLGLAGNTHRSGKNVPRGHKSA